MAYVQITTMQKSNVEEWRMGFLSGTIVHTLPHPLNPWSDFVIQQTHIARIVQQSISSIASETQIHFGTKVREGTASVANMPFIFSDPGSTRDKRADNDLYSIPIPAPWNIQA